MKSILLMMHEIDYAQRSYWRNPSSAFFTFAFPIVMLVIFASALRDARFAGALGTTYPQYYVPGIVALGVISACYTNLAVRMCVLRDLGVLKRIRGTPLPPWIFMAGNIGSCLVISGLLVTLTTAIGMLFYDVTIPRHLLALLAALVSGAFCFCALGLAVTVFVPYASAAPAMVNGLIFPLLFVSGTFFPVSGDSALAQIARLFPILHFHRAVFATFNPSVVARIIDPYHFAMLFGWGAVGLLVAVWRFRWEPRQR